MAVQAFIASTDYAQVGRYLNGFYIAENGADPGAEARVLIRDGSAGGTIFIDIRLTAKQAVYHSLVKPLRFPNGIYVAVTVGAVRGSIDVT